MKSKLLYVNMQFLYIAILVVKCYNYRSQEQIVQVCFGIIVPIILLASHDALQRDKKTLPSTYWAIQLLLRGVALLLLAFEDDILRNTHQTALSSFQALLFGMFLMKFTISKRNCSEQKYIMQVILAFEGVVLINVNQFFHMDGYLMGNICLIVLTFCFFCTIVFNNHNYQSSSGRWKGKSALDNQKPHLALDMGGRQDGVESIMSYERQAADCHPAPNYSGENEHLHQLLEEQRSFFKVLFDQLPYGIIIRSTSGMLILSETNQIQHHNIFVTELMQCNNEREAFSKILNLKNCSKQMREQEQFNELFKALNSKLTQGILNPNYSVKMSDEQRPPSQVQSFHFDMETFQSKQHTVEIEYDHVKQVSKNLFKKPRPPSVTAKETGHEKFQFVCEAKMICCREDVLEDSESMSSQQLYEVILRPYLYEHKLFVLLLVRDVTLFNQVSVLQKVNENKSLMLAQVAHEFRNPLGIIISFTVNLIDQLGLNHVITQEYESQPYGSYLMPIESSANQLLSLVNDLLDLAQLRAGRFKLTNERFDLVELLVQILNLMTLQTRAKNLSLQLIVEPHQARHIVVSDPKRIQQIVMNLISNSIKFTSQGGVTLELVRQKDSNSIITLRDTGAGIVKEDQDKLFKAFSKLQGTSSMNRQGVGLGLMISNILAQKLSSNGTGLQIHSDGKDKGSAFTFSVQDHSNSHLDDEAAQREISEMQQPQPAKSLPQYRMTVQEGRRFYKFGFREESLSNYSGNNLKFNSQNEHGATGSPPVAIESDYQAFRPCKCMEILMVDDEAFNIQAFRQGMEKYNIKLDSASTFHECIDKITTFNRHPGCQFMCNSYKVIILDIEMPYRDGYQTAESIRSLENAKNLPKAFIFAYTAHSGQDINQKIVKAGMDDLISKPIRPKDFINKLKQVIIHQR